MLAEVDADFSLVVVCEASGEVYVVVAAAVFGEEWYVVLQLVGVAV